MGFRENLKEELSLKNMLVNELAVKSGVKKRSLDKYLTENGSVPSAEAAVKIARALGVSVEFLVTGRDPHVEAARNSAYGDIRELVRTLETLDESSRGFMLTTAKALKKMLDKQTRSP
ncbi:MAG: helix-turn-helix domain-containing protein [Treponema sp.]|jgi:transcriptional regulator with XRE-family HTH domain|nr:helix-turn-helix domain-containing protein [Treponema sp.]